MYLIYTNQAPRLKYLDLHTCNINYRIEMLYHHMSIAYTDHCQYSFEPQSNYQNKTLKIDQLSHHVNPLCHYKIQTYSPNHFEMNLH